MARLAILQLIVDEDDPARIGTLMERAAQLLQEAGIAMAVRTSECDGDPITGDVPWRAKLDLARQAFDPATAWPEHFMLPFNRVFSTDETGEGALTLRVHSCMKAPGSIQGDIDLQVDVTDDGVRVALFPRGVYRNVCLNGSRAQLTFEEATLQQAVQPRPPTLAGLAGRLFDRATGRPIIGPAMSVVAVGRYKLAEARPDGGFSLKGVVLDNYHDHTATEMVDRRSGGPEEALFFTDQGHIVPASRLELRVPTTSGG